MQGALVEIEGRKRAHYWTFTIVKHVGNTEAITLVRCSHEDKSQYEKWLKVSRVH